MHINTLSSCVFVSNTIVLLLKGLHRHAFLFSFLFLTSVMFHELKTLQFFYLDQIAIFLVTLNGAWLMYKNYRVSPALIVAVTTFLATIYFYYYGQLNRSYCYDPDCGSEWHAFLHVVSSVGHHAIAAL